ncbi:MAG: ABC transporter ATP-binding protein [Lachnospiraceae bacterium]|nr:ABC transporter ATP-binding protein [Lachnospiraceae bacterium]
MLLEFEQVTGIEKQFKLENISFALPAGYIMGLAGKNGAGKSTLIDYIINPNQRYTGTIRINGVDIRENHTAMRNWIGLVSDENPFLEERTALQNAEMLGGLYQEWDMELFRSAMKKMGVSVSRTVGKMSRGERLKFQMAFAMAHHTKLYLLDEVTAGMDPVFRVEFFKMLNEVIAQEDVSVLMTSHVPEEIERKMDYVGVLKDGKLVSFGESLDVMRGGTGEKESLESNRTQELSVESPAQESVSEEISVAEAKVSHSHRITVEEFFHEFLSWRAESVGTWIGCGFLELMFIIGVIVPVQEAEYELLLWAAFMGVMGVIVYLRPYVNFVENGKGQRIYQKIKYFPVDLTEIRQFRIERLLRFTARIAIGIGLVHLLIAQFAYGGIILENILVVVGLGFLLPFGVGLLSVMVEK